MDSEHKRPNILFAFADDWGRYASAYSKVYGEDSICALLDTPNFDRVADEGVLFTQAFVPAPTCTPCRSSVLSGRYFWQTGLGAILQGAVWDRNIPSYPFMLRDAGYHIGFTYKVWGPGTPPNDPYGGTDTQYQPAGSSYGQFSHYVTRTAEEAGGVENAKQHLYDETRQNFRAFLADRKGDQPFCYWWGPTNTHRTWERGSGKALWGLEPDDLKGRLPAFLPDVHEVREDACDYLGECQAVDAGLGVLFDELEAIGELDNTLIVVSGDHGIPGFPRGKCNLYDIGSEVALAVRLPGIVSPGRVVDDVINLMDLAPTFLELAGVTPDPGMPAKSFLDVLQSDGDGQVDSERTYVVTGRERHVAQAREWNLPYPQRAIRTHTHLYIRNYAPDRWPMGDPRGMDDPTREPPPFEKIERDTFTCYSDLDAGPSKAWMVHHRADESVRDLFALGFGKRPEEELYDLAADPDHMQNLADDPTCAGLKELLAAQLQHVLEEQRDPRATGENCRFEQAPFTDWPCPDEEAERRKLMVRQTL